MAGMGGHHVLIRILLQLPPTPAPRGARMVPAPTVAAVILAPRTGLKKHTDIKQSRVTPTLPLVAVAAAVVAVAMVPALPGPSATTVTATLALGKLNCINYTTGPFH